MSEDRPGVAQLDEGTLPSPPDSLQAWLIAMTVMLNEGHRSVAYLLEATGEPEALARGMTLALRDHPDAQAFGRAGATVVTAHVLDLASRVRQVEDDEPADGASSRPPVNADDVPGTNPQGPLP